jgi:hypothetical protein
VRWPLTLLLLVACKQAPSPAVEAPGDQATPGSAAAMHAGMGQLLVDATAARDLLIAGRLDAARKHLKAVATAPTPADLPEGAEPSLEALRTAARSGQGADRPETLAPAIAKVGAACGGCHSAFAGGPGLSTPPRLPTEGHMARHSWAAERMWEGLIAPSVARYEMGAAALLMESGSDEGLYAGLDPSEMRAASVLHKLVHADAELAATTDEQGRRVELYGALIGACAECHAIKGGPGR